MSINSSERSRVTKTCYVLESTPKEAGAAYSKRIFWILKDEWRAVKIEYFDQKKNPSRPRPFSGRRAVTYGYGRMPR